ncbi:MAG: UDP-N-acetylmuramoyl-tripeptide--D-alanyl-D-alanine ligase, partial [Calditrichaeota bacterium]
HNAINALAAIAVATYYQVPGEDIAAAFRQPVEIPGRMRQFQLGGRIIIDDTYNANPESMKAALSYLQAQPGARKKIAVLGDMFELGRLSGRAHVEILQWAQSQELDSIFVTGEAMQQAVKSMRGRKNNVVYRGDKQALARELARITRAGDFILVKGSRGMKMEEIIRHLQEQLSTQYGEEANH